MRTKVAHVAAILLLLASLPLAAACGKSADVELEAAKKAIADARKASAWECAKELFAAAEAKLAEALRLADKKMIDAARAKAQEAEVLAGQARSASPPGCEQIARKDDEEEEEEEEDPNIALRGQNVSGTLRIGDLEQTIYFDFNEANIREDSKAVLTQVADMMRRENGLKIEVEGHCDTRGSTEYNLQLGERRARSVEKYLITQGVSQNQIQTISYGEERPVDLSEDENAHQKNRRAEIKKR